MYVKANHAYMFNHILFGCVKCRFLNTPSPVSHIAQCLLCLACDSLGFQVVNLLNGFLACNSLRFQVDLVQQSELTFGIYLQIAKLD